jgi:hypothetical protein
LKILKGWRGLGVGWGKAETGLNPACGAGPGRHHRRQAKPEPAKPLASAEVLDFTWQQQDRKIFFNFSANLPMIVSDGDFQPSVPRLRCPRMAISSHRFHACVANGVV